MSLPLLLFATSLFQIGSYTSGMSRSKPDIHTVGLIIAYVIIVPHILKSTPEWYSIEMQIVLNVLVLLLDWFSFHQDMTRFSEESLCIFGNCRKNSMITGILAHVADVVSVSVLLYPFINTPLSKTLFYCGVVMYTIIGSVVIYNMTKDGSVSDLRGKSTERKCDQARIMRPNWRGGLNDLISVLGIFVAWQSFFNCKEMSCNSKYFPFDQLKNLAGTRTGSPIVFYVRFALLFLLTVVPIYLNYVNTSYQHGKLSAKTYKIPACFE